MLSCKEKIFDQLGTPKSPDAIRTVENFLDWRDVVTNDELIQMVYRGNLKTTAIATSIQDKLGISFGKSALTQNDWVKALRVEFEDYLREKSVLPELSNEAKEEASKGSQENPKNYDSKKQQSIRDAMRLKALEEENMQLKQRLERIESERMTKQSIYADLAEFGANFEK